MNKTVNWSIVLRNPSINADHQEGNYCSAGSISSPSTSCSNICGVEAPPEQIEQHACELGCTVNILIHKELQFYYRNDMPLLTNNDAARVGLSMCLRYIAALDW